jgi:arylsulfatase A-like enzyme
MGCGQHGGLGRYEQSPFLMIEGAGFAAGAGRDEPSSAVDIAPTVLTHLGVPFDNLDGRPLQRRTGA